MFNDELSTTILKEGKKKMEYAKQAWFDAYYEGNSLIPQTSEGINICLIHELLRESNINWNDFSSSIFSDEQIKFIGTAMSRMHVARGINVTTESEKNLTPPSSSRSVRVTGIVSLERLQLLWTSERGRVLRLIHRYVCFTKHIDPDSPVEIKEIESFFSNPTNPDVIQYREAISAMYRVLKSQEMKIFLSDYRDRFKDYTGSSGWSWLDYEKDFKKALLTGVKNIPDRVYTDKIVDFLVENL